MSEPEIPEAATETPGRSRFLSYVWLIPLVTLVILASVLWQTYGNRGPVITIDFLRGTGIEAGKTPLRFRGIQIGLVESVDLGKDGAGVLVRARLHQEVESHLNDSARFWIVRPRVSGSQISGLDTLLGGTYIGMSWVQDHDGPSVRRFSGLDEPPVTPAGTPGRHIELVARHGAAIAVGAPIYFKNLPVGRIETRRLNADGSGVTYLAFVDAPHDQRISDESRFWNVTGFTIDVGSEGAKLRVESLLTLIEGGVAFDNFPAPRGAMPSREGTGFTLYADADEARESVLEPAPGQEVRLTAVFGGSVRGLKAGAPVEYRGVQIGDVEEVQVDLSAGNDDASITTVLRIQPLRFSPQAPSREQVIQSFEQRVRGGLRAQLASSNLLTGVLYVSLVERPEAEPASLNLDARPYPRLPSVPTDIAAIASSAEALMNRLRDLPLEDTMNALTRVLDDAHVLLASDAARALPDSVNQAVLNIAELAGDSGSRQVPGQLAGTLRETRAFIGKLNELEVAQRAAGTLDSAQRTAAALEKASSGLPQLIDALNKTAGNAEALLAGLKPGSEMHYELQRALAEVRRAAQAVAGLATKLQAKPNAIILGK